MFSTATDRDFTRNFLISLGAHAVFVLLAFFGGQALVKIIGSNNDIEIIKSAVRVDVVGMPKFTVQELKVMQKEPTPEAVPEAASGKKEEAKPETEDVIKKDDLVIQENTKEKKKASFLNMLNDYSNKKVAPKVEKKGTSGGKGKESLDSLILEGNRLSQGSALVGDYSDEQNSEFASYVQTLPGIIRVHWKLPSYLMGQNLRCRILIYLSPTGHVLKLEVKESSGQAEFDSRAEAAIRAAAPFPKPSDSVGARLTNSGIILGFPL